jgi:glycosyltransferase involved in cell wall biosynthesis
MVLIEAMASGLPCVAYDCPCGPRGVLTHGEDGFFIENGNEMDYVNAVETLIENIKLREEMGEKSKVSSENTRSILLWKLGINYIGLQN